jgi:flagellar export protein FliJ
MAISDTLRRLLHVRILEEEQRKIALESALAEVQRLESALCAAHARERFGREHVGLSFQSGDTADRVAGLKESDSARRGAQSLRVHLSEAVLRAVQSREEYLPKRVERRQVETVIREAEDAQAAEDARRDQQGIDEWFSAHRHSLDADAAADRQNSAEPEIKNRKEIPSIPEEELRSNL